MLNEPSVLYIVPSAGIGGAETFLKHVQLYSEKHRPVFCFLREGPLLDWMVGAGATVYVCDHNVRLSRVLSVIKTLEWLRKVGKRENVSCVHSTMAYGAILGAPAAKSLGCKHVWFQHGPVNGWMTTLATWLPYSFVLTNSKYTFTAQKKFGSSAKKMKHVQLGVEESWFKEPALEEMQSVDALRTKIGSKLGLSGDFPLFSILCRLDEGKGVHLLIEAVSKVIESSNEKRFAVAIFGEELDITNPYHKKLHEMTRGLPIVFMGPNVRAKIALLSSKFLVCASTWPETFGLTIVEAMSLGVVPIVPREGGPVDLIEDGDCGVFFTPRDSDSLAHEMEKLLLEFSVVDKLSENARNRARWRFRAKRGIHDMEKIYFES